MFSEPHKNDKTHGHHESIKLLRFLAIENVFFYLSIAFHMKGRLFTQNNEMLLTIKSVAIQVLANFQSHILKIRNDKIK